LSGAITGAPSVDWKRAVGATKKTTKEVKKKTIFARPAHVAILWAFVAFADAKHVK
jgi:hypothetical protein